MSYVSKNLMSGEEVLYTAKIHWGVYFTPIILFIIAILLFFVATDGLSSLFGLFFLIGGIIKVIESFFYSKTTELAVTTKRIIAKVGFIKRDTIELNHEKVESLSVNQSVLGRILNFGALTVNGTGGVKTPIKNISSPIDFRNQVNSAIESK